MCNMNFPFFGSKNFWQLPFFLVQFCNTSKHLLAIKFMTKINCHPYFGAGNIQDPNIFGCKTFSESIFLFDNLTLPPGQKGISLNVSLESSPGIQQQKMTNQNHLTPRKVTISKSLFFNGHENKAAKFTVFLACCTGRSNDVYLQLKVVFCHK